MNTTTTQNNSAFENCMNIHLLSFILPKNVIQEKDDVRVSISTIPDDKKQHFSIEGKKMNNANHVFSLNITNKTDKVVKVFRKKTPLSTNPIIASATIHLNNFKNVPKERITCGVITSDVQRLNIYYPLQKQMREEHTGNIERKVLGSMEIQLSFATSFVEIEKCKKMKAKKEIKINKNNNHSDSKVCKIQRKKQDRKNSYEKLSDEDCLYNSYLI